MLQVKLKRANAYANRVVFDKQGNFWLWRIVVFQRGSLVEGLVPYNGDIFIGGAFKRRSETKHFSSHNEKADWLLDNLPQPGCYDPRMDSYSPTPKTNYKVTLKKTFVAFHAERIIHTMLNVENVFTQPGEDGSKITIHKYDTSEHWMTQDGDQKTAKRQVAVGSRPYQPVFHQNRQLKRPPALIESMGMAAAFAGKDLSYTVDCLSPFQILMGEGLYRSYPKEEIIDAKRNYISDFRKFSAHWNTSKMKKTVSAPREGPTSRIMDGGAMMAPTLIKEVLSEDIRNIILPISAPTDAMVTISKSLSLSNRDNAERVRMNGFLINATLLNSLSRCKTYEAFLDINSERPTTWWPKKHHFELAREGKIVLPNLFIGKMLDKLETWLELFWHDMSLHKAVVVEDGVIRVDPSLSLEQLNFLFKKIKTE